MTRIRSVGSPRVQQELCRPAAQLAGRTGDEQMRALSAVLHRDRVYRRPVWRSAVQDLPMQWDVRFASFKPAEGAPTFVQSVVVGNVVFVSGCTADARSVEDQVDLALEHTRGALEAAGSRMENVVKTLFLLTSLDHYGRVRKAETEFYERCAPQLVKTPPAATLMVVPSLARPESLVQYEVDGCARSRHARLAGDVLPRVLGRQGARVSACPEGACEVRRGASRSGICSSSPVARRSITQRRESRPATSRSNPTSCSRRSGSPSRRRAGRSPTS